MEENISYIVIHACQLEWKPNLNDADCYTPDNTPTRFN